MSYVIDEYFENLVLQLRNGTLSSGELIQKIEGSELNSLQTTNPNILSPRAASIQEIKDDPSFEELCHQAELLLSNAPTLPKPKNLYIDPRSNASGSKHLIFDVTNENAHGMYTPKRSPSFNQNPYLYLDRDPLEEIETLNIQPEKLFQSLVITANIHMF